MAETAQASAPLDDIMLAMDVVDTLRHREHLVTRELNESAREAALLERLREIYRGQGIAVSDDILAEGVRALKESRFVYTPPAPGLQVSLARLYVRRGKFLRWVVAVLLLIGIAWGGYQWAYVWPRERAAESLRVEMTETLPARIVALGEEIGTLAQVDEARIRAVDLMADGERALAGNDADAARKAVAELSALRDTLLAEYTMTIVSRPGELSGVWRVPDANPDARNHYLIVEALDRDGNPVTVTVRNEEDGSLQRVTRWGVRVSENVFRRVGADKSDDGIIQNNRVAVKRRGFLEPDYLLPVMGGTITDW